MRIPSCIVTVTAFIACTNAQFTTHAAKRTAAATATAPSGGAATGCAAVQVAALKAGKSSSAYVKASDALACLQSVPLDVRRSSDFCDYIKPYFQFQSTIAYLKDPPEGWTLPGCDFLGGLAEIKSNVNSGVYKSQWEFETDLYQLGNFMPHDFHVNLPMPLVNTFIFVTKGGPLVSISSDGVSVPDIYFKNDIDAKRANPNLGWTPSPLKQVNGQDAAAYLEELTQLNSPFQDPDALFNQALISLAFNYTAIANGIPSGNVFVYHNTFGFTADSYDYTFNNGSTNIIDNAAITNVDFTQVSSGSDLFNLVDLPPPGPAASSSAILSAAATSATPISLPASYTYSSLFGYPTPEVIHTDGYVSGYFLNSSVAVLAMQSFIDAREKNPEAAQIQQSTIKQFLALCKQQGATKLIVDLQTNGGGKVFSGFDAFKQLFPTIDPFGATRLRSTPMVNYFGTIFSEADISSYNNSVNTEYQIQANVDGNGQPFTSWSQADPPDVIYGDNFTAELRYNFSDVTVEALGGGFNISGYLSNSDIAAQVFQSEDIVILYDGSCGSTCSVFSELMKSQGGVRSVAVGGRPQTGPMQGVAGSKGAQVLTYGDIQKMYSEVSYVSSVVQQKGDTLPPLPSPSSLWVPSISDFPLGNSKSLQGSGFNLRNNMHINDTSFTPLQFIYEAANCRLFFVEDDLYDISGLWQRVADVAWNGGKCVSGSTVNSDNTIGAGPYDTVGFSSSVVSNVKQAYSPGLVALVNGNSSAPGGGTPTGSSPLGTGSGTGLATPSPTKKAGANGLKASGFGAFLVFIGMSLWVL